MNNFSPNVTQILTYSREEALRLGAAVVLPEHIMLALLRDDSGFIPSLLSGANIDIKTLRSQLESRVIEPSPHGIALENIQLSDMATQIVRMSVLEARMQHVDTIEAAHLLLAILHDRINNGAKIVLNNNNLSYDGLTKLLHASTDSQGNPTDIDSYFDSKDESDIDNDDDDDVVGDDGGDKVIIRDLDARNHHDNAYAPDSDDDDDDEDDDDDDLPFGGPKSSKTQKTAPNKTSKTPALDNFSVDFTKAAAEGKLDPCIGREREIQRVMEILCRRKKNNPILIGEPGVGKSAIVEGLAQMIQKHDVSPVLFNKRLLSLDLTAIVAGTKYRGQFEERIKLIIKELESNPDIIIFIDEIHTIIGAGSAAGTMDAANILKPALARGTIQCIGATTLDEYRKSIEKDGALERRFQKVIVEATTAEQTLQILLNLKPRYERYHQVYFSDAAVEACVRLTDRYITERAFPDKAIDAMDEAGARMHLDTAKTPPQIIEIEKEIDEVRKKKKSAVFNQNFELAAAYRDKQVELEDKLSHFRKYWESNAPVNGPEVTEENVADVVAMMSGVPVQQVCSEENERLRHLGDTLSGQVIGQQKAIDKVVKAIQRNRLGLRAPTRPVGVFMFLGPTGVGKTYLAQQLAKEMFGSMDALIRIDMSEYNESFNTSRLVGAPPGYVGYEEGGQLTERVRRHPYSIVLLDEIEKAHPNVYNILLQVLDEGRLTDGNGRLVDFRNTIIIMTSNAGTRQLKEFGRGVGFQSAGNVGLHMNDNDREHARSILQKALSKQFQPEFLNRLDDIVTFDQLDLGSIKKIITLELRGITKRLSDMGYKLHLTDGAKDFIAEKGYDVQYGARPLKRAIQTYVEDVVCERLLDGTITPGDTITIDKKTLESR